MPPVQLQQLFNELSAALVLYARQWCTLPDDAVQEAFIDLAKSTSDPDCPKSWLFTTTRRKAQNIARSERRRQTHQNAAAQWFTAHEEPKSWFRSTGSAPLVAEDVVRGLQSLESDQRELLVARIWGELNFEQLAELLECSVSSAHRRYSAALQNLKAALTSALDSPSHPSPIQPVSQNTLPTNAKLDPLPQWADGEIG
jgi:RNA polymerase sigma factor (sigma-70 family)